MGRGLSKLQKTILHEGRKCSPSTGSVVAVVDTARVLARYLAWPSMGFLGDNRRKRKARRGELQHPKAPSKADVTDPSRNYAPNAYGTAHAAISRAVRRLEERGLLLRSRQGSPVLTEEGLTVAKGIDVAETFRQPTWVEAEMDPDLSQEEREAIAQAQARRASPEERSENETRAMESVWAYLQLQGAMTQAQVDRERASWSAATVLETRGRILSRKRAPTAR